jgi:MoxR-like ATPase
LDRFLVKLKVDYPSTEDETRIVAGDLTKTPVNTVLDTRALRELREAVEAVFIDPKITGYIISIIQATRISEQHKRHAEGIYRYITYGASVRGSAAVYKCARIRAMLEGRDFVTPDDVKKIVPDALRHRLVLSYEAEAEAVDTDNVLARILSSIKVP